MEIEDHHLIAIKWDDSVGNCTWMLGLVGRVCGIGYHYNIGIFPHQILINYLLKTWAFKVEKAVKHH